VFIPQHQQQQKRYQIQEHYQQQPIVQGQVPLKQSEWVPTKREVSSKKTEQTSLGKSAIRRYNLKNALKLQKSRAT